MENLILALTNIYAIRAIIRYTNNGNIYQAISIAMAAVASFAYHLIECHKNNMPGIGIFTSTKYHHIFINIDRVCAVVAVLVCINQNVINYIPHMVISLLALIISEQLSIFTKYPQLVHVISHSVWHIGVFELARLL